MYAWLVFVHLLGLVVFALAHGVSVFVAFRVRRERDARVITALLGLSQTAVIGLYVGLLLLGVGGMAAAWQGGLLTAPWVVASYVVLFVTLVVMWAVASPYYMNLRKGIEDGSVDEAGMVAALQSRRPELLLGAGAVGLVVLVWLMVLKPG